MTQGHLPHTLYNKTVTWTPTPPPHTHIRKSLRRSGWWRSSIFPKEEWMKMARGLENDRIILFRMALGHHDSMLLYRGLFGNWGTNVYISDYITKGNPHTIKHGQWMAILLENNTMHEADTHDWIPRVNRDSSKHICNPSEKLPELCNRATWDHCTYPVTTCGVLAQLGLWHLRIWSQSEYLGEYNLWN